MAELFGLSGWQVVPSPHGQSRLDMKMQQCPGKPRWALNTKQLEVLILGSQTELLVLSGYGENQLTPTLLPAWQHLTAWGSQ